MDRDKIVGGILSVVLFAGYIFYSQHYQQQVKNYKPTIEVAEKKFDNYDSKFESEGLKENSKEEVFFKNTFFSNKFVTAETSQKNSIENESLKIIFDTNGGKIFDVFLKNEVDGKKSPVKLVAGENGSTGFSFKFQNKIINTNDLVFAVDQENSDSKKITFVCDLGEERSIKQSYQLEEKGFVVEHCWNFFNSNQYFDANAINFVWNNVLLTQENDRDYCQKKTTINYLTSKDKFDGFSEASPKIQSAQIPAVKWIALKQRFFTIGIDGLDNFRNASLTLTPNNNEKFLKDVNIDVQISELNGNSSKNMGGKIRYFFGPKNYSSLKNFSYKFDQNLYLGWIIVRQVNEYCFLPLINFLHNYVSEVILLIFLLVLMVKLLIFPFTYKSNIAMAEMRLLNPTLTLLKEKYKDQPEVLQVEQMKLYQEMGISPLGGCLPLLLQMPIIIAMLNLIPNINCFRGKGFLWVQDWSSFDSICNLPFHVPIYGDHVSLFALLMTLSSISFSIMNSKSASGPQMGMQMKFMNYFLPATFLFAMNSLPAALNLYYLFSNLTALLQQFLTSKFMDDEKIKKKLEERKRKGKNGGNSFNEKIQHIIDSQKKSK
ncbi:MAG: membrane protein insertase YidC [Cytophagales bacterium]|jgi:YidC/Oxa1 family membrane protein insertase|nr:membrane protein insertase YidC [Cytophagales bacterium]